jgi:hypothetical protein
MSKLANDLIFNVPINNVLMCQFLFEFQLFSYNVEKNMYLCQH